MDNHPEKGDDLSNCRSCFERLSEYIDHELGNSGMDEIKMHLENCICCSSCYLTLKKTVEICGKLNDKPVPNGLASRLRFLCEKMAG